jgi:hypothetical protein
MRNLLAGDFGPLDRASKVLGNLARRRNGRCCGNYGDPGC